VGEVESRMNPRFIITHAMTQGLARIERARGFLEARGDPSELLEL